MEFVKHLQCLHCGRTYEALPAAYTCPECGFFGILDVVYDYEAIGRRYRPADLDGSDDPSLWRFLPLLPVDPDRPRSPLRHGGTPLIRAPGMAKALGIGTVWIKDEGLNPTGSLKDRASAVAVVKAQEAEASVIICSSTGNAASSLAGACASLGMSSVILVPHYAAEGKVAQLLIFGATVVSIQGSYQQAYQLCEDAVARFGWYNRNCAVNPYLVEGKKTCGLEIAQQLGWDAPDWVVVSVGDGCTIGGIYKGFTDLYQLGWIPRLPKLLAVQAKGSPGIYNYHQTGRVEAVRENTIADGISIGLPRNARRASGAVKDSGGAFLLVGDEEIRSAMRFMGRTAGVFGEPAAGAAAAGLRRAAAEGLIGPNDRVVLVSTGNGMKDSRNAIAATGSPEKIEPTLQAMIDSLPPDLVPRAV